MHNKPALVKGEVLKFCQRKWDYGIISDKKAESSAMRRERSEIILNVIIIDMQMYGM